MRRWTVVAMTLLPDADYPEVIRVLTGLLPRLPWARRWQVPAHKTVTAWRRRLGKWPLEQLFWRVAGPLVSDGAPGSVMIAGKPLCANPRISSSASHGFFSRFNRSTRCALVSLVAMFSTNISAKIKTHRQLARWRWVYVCRI